VGPQSSGAVPGPAAYGKGGVLPTTTDAAANLGMLGPGHLASGIHLDFDKAAKALQTLAGSLRLSVQEAAVGVLRIASTNMANTIREITLERGLDPRGMALLPFGGAGPMMATLLADELELQTIIVPVLPGNFSAWGLLGADMIQSIARTRIRALEDASIAELNRLLPELFAELHERAGGHVEGAEHLLKLDLRYRGQEHWLSVDVPLEQKRVETDAASIHSSFTANYEQTFGTVLPGVVEIVAARATIRRLLPKRKQPVEAPQAANGKELSPASAFEAYSFELGKRVSFGLRTRDSIHSPVKGPMIVTESTATIYIDANWLASVGKLGELVLTRQEAV
jgi:N-methylhydantoinase A